MYMHSNAFSVSVKRIMIGIYVSTFNQVRAEYGIVRQYRSIHVGMKRTICIKNFGGDVSRKTTICKIEDIGG